jgi:class 3 adenylate cyclase/NAD(P)-dependent dehydrogenase (short-subunit alcohol dehydrogenase family)
VKELLSKLELDPAHFDGRVAVVTGGARGIGEQVAWGLAHLGAHVIILDVRELGEEVANRIRGNSRSAEFKKVDLADQEALDQVAQEILAAHQGVHVLVNNASKFKARRFLDAPTSQWDDLHYTTARASTLLIKRFLPTMIYNGSGVICNTIAAEGLTHVAHFSAAMAGQRSMVLSLAGEYPPESNIHCFGFAPGVVDTPLVHEGLDDLLLMQGITPEQYFLGLRNPGYQGLMPVDHCGASYVYCLAHAREYHGQLTDAFHPLINFGIIDPEAFADRGPVAPETEFGELREVNAYVEGVSSSNLNLERRIIERTKELEAANQQLAAQKQYVENVSTKLSRYLPQQVYRSIFSGDLDAEIQTHRKHLTIFFSDIRDFTRKTERLEPEAMSSILNSYFSAMTEIAKDLGATVDKFVGDAMVAFFGDPETLGSAVDARQCLKMAIAMQRKMAMMQAKFAQMGLQDGLEIRIGINSGYCTVGNFGSYDRMDYTILGSPVNIAARLQENCPPNGIVVSHATQALSGNAFTFRSLGSMKLKGIGEDIDAYSLVFDILQTDSVQNDVDRKLASIKARLSMIEVGELDENEKEALLEEMAALLKS